MVHVGFLITFYSCGVKRKRRVGGLKAAEKKHQNLSLALYCLMMLSTFLCACHPYVLSDEVLRLFAHLLNWIVCFLELYVLEVSPLSVMFCRRFQWLDFF